MTRPDPLPPVGWSEPGLRSAGTAGGNGRFRRASGRLAAFGRDVPEADLRMAPVQADLVVAVVAEHTRYLEAESPAGGLTDFPFLNSNPFCVRPT